MAKKQKKMEIMRVGKGFENKIKKELQEEYEQKVRDKIKTKMKTIAMTKKLLEKEERELKAMMNGKKEILSEDEYLFN